MAISLVKGQKVNLTSSNPGMSRILIGLGWDTNRYDGGHAFDLDAVAFLLGENAMVTGDLDFIYFNNLVGGGGSVRHLGDNLTGEGEGDDEMLTIDLAAVPGTVQKIHVAVTIHEADTRGQNFGQVSNAFIRIVDQNTNAELMRYDLGEDFSIETAVIAGELYRHGGEWKFNAVGSGFAGGLGALARQYGVNV